MNDADEPPDAAAARAPRAVPVPPSGALPLAHALLALAVVAVWGTNFVVIRHALEVWPPLWLAALRFAVALVPLVAGMALAAAGVGRARTLPRPAVPWRDLLAYGLLIGAGQFGLLFWAMKGHISPGLASLVIQTQVFFTVGLAMLTAGERVKALQVGAALLAVAGLATIVRHTDGQTTPLGLAMILAAALSWACGNLVARRARGVSALAYVVWASLGAVPPLAAMAWWLEGPAALVTAAGAAGPSHWASLLWQTVGNTLFGYSAWGWLLVRHPAATVVPWALLVPVFGMGAAALLLGEPMPGWKLGAAALVIAGLAVNVAATRPWSSRRREGAA